MMKLTVLGAAGEVTGSSYLVETSRARVLVDCGLFQGKGATDEKNLQLGPFEPAALHAVVLTHAHLDHAGRLPLLKGLRCRIHATRATCDLAELLLEDSAHIQVMDAERENRYRERDGEPLVAPLYTKEDAAKIQPHFAGMSYDEDVEVAPGVQVRMQEAGHILGSASVLLTVSDGGRTVRIAFSGDIGQHGMPIMKDPVPCPRADVVVLESTYGDRNHRSPGETLAELEDTLKQAAWNKQKLICPAFAIGRTQLLLSALAQIVRNQSAPEVPIYLDSPLAIRATEVYGKHAAEFDDEARRLHQSGQMRHDLRNVQALLTPAESRSLNDKWEPCVVIAGSGMCTGGRILHHLRHNLWKRGVQVLMTSFMAEGTLGRRLVDRAPVVRIFKEDVPVRATVRTINGLSGHAGQSGLLDWMQQAVPAKPQVILTHGEPGPRNALAAKAEERFGLRPECPQRFAVFEL